MRTRGGWRGRGRRLDREFEAEMAHHLEREREKLERAGVPAAEAARRARAIFGGRDDAAEGIREARGGAGLATVGQDLRFALRLWRRAPAQSAAIVLTLALGLGANAAIFNLINAALLRPLPVPHAEQLAQLLVAQPGQAQPGDTFASPVLRQLREQTRVFQGVMGFRDAPKIDVEFQGHGELSAGQFVTGDYFPTLELRPELGRLFSMADETAAGANPVAVLSDQYWRSRFAGNAGIVGAQLVINNAPFRVAGVAPPGFFGVQPGTHIDVFVPVTMVGAVSPSLAALHTPFDILTSPVRPWLDVLARLQPALTPARAAAQLQPAFHVAMESAANGLAGLPFDSPAARNALLESRLIAVDGGTGLAALRQRFSRPLWILLGIVALLLLLACTNIASVLLAQGAARERELATRRALGASRSRLVRQFFTESVCLGLAGGVLAWLVAERGTPLLVRLASPSTAPVSLDLHFDPRVWAFLISAAALSVLLFGLAPARAAARQTGRVQTSSGLRLGNRLAAVQVALSLVLVVGAGLLAGSLRDLTHVDPGFNPNQVLLLSLDPGSVGIQRGNPALVPLDQRLLARLRALPGVRAATLSVHDPLDRRGATSAVVVPGVPPQAGAGFRVVGVEAAGPEYFSTLQAPLLAGRDFAASDAAGAPKVVIINRALRDQYFGSEDAVGRQLRMAGYRGDASPLTVIGVVANIKTHDLREAPEPMAYVAFLQYPESGVTVELRTALAPEALADAAVRAIGEIAPRLPVYNLRSLEQQVDDSLVQERLLARLAVAFSVLALLLASVGLYGVLGHAVSRRTREIGVRMALGARRAAVAGMILRDGLITAGIGIGLGLAAALLAARSLGSQLHGLSASDPLTYAAAVGLVLAVTCAASLIPALRALHVDPIQALRCD
ncbi:MAG TPA: ABC transporter permease [Terriglobales bacterium]|nr:ABC transporter permease [Terriglobales bacterium]